VNTRLDHFSEPSVEVLQLVTGVNSQSLERMARHPWGRVPAITTSDGFTLYESHAIAKYLTAKHGFALLPPSSDLEAVALLFDRAESCQLCYFRGPAGVVSLEKFFKKIADMPTDEAAILAALKKLDEFFAVADGILAKQEYMAGSSYSLADILHSFGGPPLCLWRGRAGKQAGNVYAWWERCLARPVVKEYVGRLLTPEQAKERIRAQNEAKQ
jgi:glutathione S-transferase